MTQDIDKKIIVEQEHENKVIRLDALSNNLKGVLICAGWRDTGTRITISNRGTNRVPKMRIHPSVLCNSYSVTSSSCQRPIVAKLESCLTRLRLQSS